MRQSRHAAKQEHTNPASLDIIWIPPRVKHAQRPAGLPANRQTKTQRGLARAIFRPEILFPTTQAAAHTPATAIIGIRRAAA